MITLPCYRHQFIGSSLSFEREEKYREILGDLQKFQASEGEYPFTWYGKVGHSLCQVYQRPLQSEDNNFSK